MLDVVTDAVEAAFEAAGDLVQSVTWRKQTAGAYNAASGVRAYTNTDVTVRAVEDEIRAGDFARLNLSAKAVKLVIPAVDFTGADPAHLDKLVHRSVTYTDKEAKFQGTKAVWEVFADV